MTLDRSLSRRGFLKQSAAAATTGVAAPLFIPRSALAAAGRPGANDRVKLGQQETRRYHERMETALRDGYEYNVKRQYEAAIDRFQCPQCGKADIDIESGRDIILKSVSGPAMDAEKETK